MNLGTLPCTQNTFSMLFDSVCAVTALITNCDKSQIATAGIPELSQFVTVAICDGSKHNFSDRFQSNRGYTPKCIKHVHIKIGPFQEGFLGTSIMGFITDIHTHKQIYRWNNTKMGKNATFQYISYKAHNRCTKETFLIGSDVDVNIFSAFRSIASGTIEINLKSYNLNRHKLRQSQIATLPSHFVICRNLWLKPWRHKLSPITLKTCSGYLGEYPGSLLTWIWEVEFWPIFVLFAICIVYYSPNMRCRNETRECI